MKKIILLLVLIMLGSSFALAVDYPVNVVISSEPEKVYLDENFEIVVSLDVPESSAGKLESLLLRISPTSGINSFDYFKAKSFETELFNGQLMESYQLSGDWVFDGFDPEEDYYFTSGLVEVGRISVAATKIPNTITFEVDEAVSELLRYSAQGPGEETEYYTFGPSTTNIEVLAHTCGDGVCTGPENFIMGDADYCPVDCGCTSNDGCDPLAPFCIESTNTCSAGEIGESCDDLGDCINTPEISNHCVAGICQDGEENSQCDDDSSCDLGFSCVDNICKDGSDGDPCYEDEQCDNDLLCYDGTCAADSDGDGIIDSVDVCVATPLDKAIFTSGEYTGCMKGDVNVDGVINNDDIGYFLSKFAKRSAEYYQPADMKEDGSINNDDIGLFLNYFSLRG
jgi:hypothetical protein